MAPSKKLPSGPIKVHLGSGPKYKAGWVNVDNNVIDRYDVNHDLNKTPWPFKDSSAERILSEHVIEHVKDWHAFISECHRILKVGGRAEIATPHTSCGRMNPYHIIPGLPVGTFVYWNKFEPDKRFRIVKERLRYTMEPLIMPLGWILNPLANLGGIGRRLCQRFWAGYVGGFEEIRWVVEKLPPSR